MKLEKSFWNNNSDRQELVVKLNAMIPAEGSVDNPRKNKALEKFRKASNCYYDLYNNGLCNRRSEFRKVFGIASTQYQVYGRYGKSHTDVFYCMVEDAMGLIVDAAAKEQGFV